MQIKFGFSEDMTRSECRAWLDYWAEIANSESGWDQLAAIRTLHELVEEYNYRYIVPAAESHRGA